MNKRRRVLAVILTMAMLISSLTMVPHNIVKAKDYSNGGCVSWVKYRAKEKLGITLPATGTHPTGLAAAVNYWTILPQKGYTKSFTPRKDALALWDGGTGTYAGYGHVAYVEDVYGNQVCLREKVLS